MRTYDKPYRLNKAPKTFEELFTTYHPVVLQQCFKAGLDPDESQDAAAHIMMKFYERDFIGLYDPAKAAFSTYIIGSARLYLRHFYTQKNLRRKREGTYVDDYLTEIENKFPVYLEIDADSAAWDRIRDFMDKRCTPEELAIFDVIVEQTKEASRVSYTAVSARAGIPTTIAKTLTDKVKDHLLEFYTDPGIASV